MTGREGGQALPLWLMVIGLASAAALGVVHVAEVAHGDARAQAVADVVALTGAGQGEETGRRVAGQMGAAVVRLATSVQGRVTVTVRVDGTEATASAELAGGG